MASVARYEIVDTIASGDFDTGYRIDGVKDRVEAGDQAGALAVQLAAETVDQQHGGDADHGSNQAARPVAEVEGEHNCQHELEQQRVRPEHGKDILGHGHLRDGRALSRVDRFIAVVADCP